MLKKGEWLFFGITLLCVVAGAGLVYNTVLLTENLVVRQQVARSKVAQCVLEGKRSEDCWTLYNGGRL